MRRIVVHQARKVVPICVEDDLTGRHVRPHPFCTCPVEMMWFALSNLFDCRAKVEKQEDTQGQCNCRDRNRSEQIAKVSLLLGRWTHPFAVQKRFEFFPEISRQTRKIWTIPFQPWLQRKTSEQHRKRRPVFRDSFPTRSHDHEGCGKKQKEDG